MRHRHAPCQAEMSNENLSLAGPARMWFGQR
jgi:hypothetical protein